MLHHTTNTTTQNVGQSVATVICDSTLNGSRITTFELVYPRYIHSELMTHRVFSRNASSSRATPLRVTLAEVREDPVFFDFVGSNKAGMVAGEALSDSDLEGFRYDWNALGRLVADAVDNMSTMYGIHKQTLNRALEPWLRIRTLVTATDWDNFFKLRLASDAQPEIRSLAIAMKQAMTLSSPDETGIHLPYIDKYFTTDVNILTRVSAARAARVSYGRLDGKKTSVDDDLKLFDRLAESGHLSPMEHQAFYKEGRHANLNNWISFRTKEFDSRS